MSYAMFLMTNTTGWPMDDGGETLKEYLENS